MTRDLVIADFSPVPIVETCPCTRPFISNACLYTLTSVKGELRLFVDPMGVEGGPLYIKCRIQHTLTKDKHTPMMHHSRVMIPRCWRTSSSKSSVRKISKENHLFTACNLLALLVMVATIRRIEE